MTGKRINDKFKILAAVLAVLAVASAAIACAALADTSNDAQSGLYANGGVNSAAQIREVQGVTVSAGGVNWTADPNKTAEIGKYDVVLVQGLFEDAKITSSINISSDVNWTVSDVTVEGACFGSDAVIDVDGAINDTNTSVTLTQAGKYTLTVTLTDGEGAADVAVFYAQIGKKQLEMSFNESYNNKEYISEYEEIEGYIEVPLLDVSLIDKVLEITDVYGYYTDHPDERVPDDGINFPNETSAQKFTVRDAGVYSVEATIKDEAFGNYEWSSGEAKNTITGFTVKQQLITSGEFNVDPGEYSAHIEEKRTGNILHVGYLPDMDKNTLTNIYKLAYEPLGGLNCEIDIECYTDMYYTNVMQESDFKVDAKKTYYIKINKLTGSIDGSNNYRNYRVPTQSDDIMAFSSVCIYLVIDEYFKISRPSAVIDYFENNPDFNAGLNELPQIPEEEKDLTTNTANIYALYKNYDYQLLQFFSGWESLHNGGKYWDVAIDGNTADPADPIKYVKSDGSPYKIVVSPKANFAWSGADTGKERSSYTYLLTIKPYEISYGNITWSSNYTYTGAELDFSGNYVSVFGDNVPVTIEIGSNSGHIVDAGKYTGKVTGFDNENEYACNYILPSEGEITHEFTVFRKRLESPDLINKGTVITGKYNGSAQQINLWGDELREKLLNIGLFANGFDDQGKPQVQSIARADISYANEWTTVGPGFVHGATYTNNDSYFTFTYAGSYTLTFKMNAVYGANYCWPDESNEPLAFEDRSSYTWENFAVIERADVSLIPADKQHISIDADYVDMKQLLTGVLQNGTTPIYSIVEFGENKTDGKTSVNQRDIDWNSVSNSYAEGNYYVLLQMADVNYKTSCRFADDANIQELDNGQIKAFYVVSSNLANVTVNVAGYTFGDNIVGSITVDDVIKISSTNMQGKMNDPVIKFYSDSARQNEVTDLVNGLPRNAGMYYLHISVTFTDGTEPWEDASSTLTAAKRPVSVSWTVDNKQTAAMQYDGSSHAVAATITNAVTGAADAALSIGGVTSVKDAGKYTFTVTGINGSEKDNYTTDGGANISFAFEITPINVTIQAKSAKPSIVFGEELKDSDLSHAYVGNVGFLSGDSHYFDEITIYVYDVNGNVITDLTRLAKGKYTLVPVWNNEQPESVGEYTKTIGNYSVTMQTATVNVTSQPLTVTVNSNGSSQYGDPVDFSNVVTVTGLANGNWQDYIEIVFKSASETVSAVMAPKGTYTVEARLKDAEGDYSLVVQDSDGNVMGTDGYNAIYTVTARSVTLTTPDITNHTYGSRYTYSILDAIGDPVLKSDLYDSNNNPKGVRVDGDVCDYNNFGNTNSVDRLYVGIYRHAILINRISIAQRRARGELIIVDGKYQYTTEVGNYKITVVLGTFEIVPKTITVSFSNGVSVYGEAIELMRSEEVIENEKTVIKYYSDVCSVGGLIFNFHTIGDAVKLVLADADGNEYDPNEVTVGAGSYFIKAVLINANYTIDNGTKVDGAEYIVGGQYVVTPLALQLELTSASNSTVYGSAFTGTFGYNIKNGSLLDGDDLGVTYGIYDGDTDVTNIISDQNVGTHYLVKLGWSNKNYSVTCSEISFSITKREVTITPNAVTNHIYGNALTANELTFSGSNFVKEEHLTALNVTAQVYNGSTAVPNADVAKLPVNMYVIRLSVANGNGNYDITLNTANFEVVKRNIEITALNVDRHVYGSTLADNELKIKVTSELGIIDGDNLNITLAVFNNNQDVTNSVASLTTGSYTIKVNAFNDNYNIATVDGVFNVVTLTVTVTFNSGASAVYGEKVDLANAYTVDGIIGDVDSVIRFSLSKNGAAVSDEHPSVGLYEVKAVWTDPNYEIKYAGEITTGSFEITQRHITITANALSHVYGDPIGNKLTSASAYSVTNDGDYTGSAIVGSDNLNIRLVVVNGSEVNDANISMLDGLSYDLKVKYDLDGNYKVNVVETAKFTVTARELTLTFTQNGGSSVYGDYNNSDLYGSAVGELTNLITGRHTYEQLVDLSLTKGGDLFVGIPTFGEYVVTAQLVSGYANNYTLKVVGTGVFNITKRTVKLEVSKNFESLTYGDSLIADPFSYKPIDGTSFVNADDEQSLNIAARVFLGKTDVTDAISTQVKGEYTVDLVWDENANYSIDVTTTVFDIVTRGVVVVFNAGGTSVYGETVNLYSNDVVDVNATKLVNGHIFADVISLKALNGSQSATAIKAPVGTYVVTAEVSADYTNKYHITSDITSDYSGTYKISQRNVTLSATAVNNHVYGDTLGTNELTYGITSGSVLDGDMLGVTPQVYDGQSAVADAKICELIVGSYTIRLSHNSNPNYSITTENADFTVVARTLTIAFTQNGGTSVYGDTVNINGSDVYTHQCDFVNGDSFGTVVKIAASKDGEPMAVSNPNVGIYEVSATLLNTNYTIVYDNNRQQGVYTITQREIGATLEKSSVEYAEDGDDYHNGVYGAARNAAVKLSDNLVDVLTLNNGFTVLYNVVGSSEKTADAPTKAGKYVVTITLTNGNYCFANGKSSVELNFEVTKKEIDVNSFSWKDSIIQYQDGQIQINSIDNYIADIMQVVSFIKTKANHDVSNVASGGNATTADSYYFENNKLYIAALGRAVYNVEFKLNDNANLNYAFSNGDSSISLAFYIVSEQITVTINSAGWQYTDIPTAADLNALVNGNVPVYGFSYEYAPVKDGVNIDELLSKKNSDNYGGFDENEVLGLYDSMNALDFVNITDRTFDVGYYVICVIYDTFDKVSDDSEMDIVRITKYDIVKVSKKQLKLHSTLGEVTFNGDTQWIDLDYRMPCDDGADIDIKHLVTAMFNGAIANSISGRDAKQYSVIFTVNDTDHYVWADEMTPNSNGEITVTWNIVQDTADNIDGKYFTVSQIDKIIYGQTVKLTNPTLNSAVKLYKGAFSWYFAAKGTLTDAAQVTEWTKADGEYKPANAGDYFVKVVFTANNKDNFTDKVGYSELTVDKKELHITLSGTLVYGNAFAQSYCKYVVVESDLINGDDSSVVSVIGSGMTYYLVDDSGDSLTDVSKLQVGNYNLTARLTNGAVHGLTADNYYIVLSEGYGVFTVTPREITVTIGNASSQYGLTPDLTGVDVTYNGVDSELVIAGVKANLTTDATNTSVVRDENYAITSTYRNNNFTINYTDGTYTVTSRKVYVTLDASNAGGTFNGTIGEVVIDTIKDADGNDISALVNAGNYLTVVYGGTAFDGTAYNGNDTHAGNFTATVSGDTSNKNFTLVHSDVAEFTVEKATLDESKIAVEPDKKVYTGEPIEPTLKQDEYFVKGLYEVVEHDPFVNVNKYTLQIRLTDSNNYKWTVSVTDIVTKNFEIVSAGILVIPSASIVYGGTFADAAPTYKLIFANDRTDVPDGIVNVDRDLIKYFVNDSKYNAEKPVVGKYALAMETDNDFVVGFTSDNYYIVLEEGLFEVTKRDIEITVSNSTSVYTQSISLTNGFQITDGELVWDDDNGAINFAITADASGWINADTYTVTATATSDNYNITNVISGTHTITPIEVTVTITAANGTYIDKAVEVTTTQTGNIAYDFGSVFASKYEFEFTGSGYKDSKAPTNAGEYTVTVTAITDGNFKLASVNTASFTIAKKVVDQDAITVCNKVYNGEEQSHGIEALDGVYTVSTGVYKDANEYSVTLTIVNSNYTWKDTADMVITKQFVIEKATLTLTPNGTLVYGQTFAEGKFTNNFSGFKANDDESVLQGKVTYALVSSVADSDLVVNNQGYGLTVMTDGDYVAGLSADNYQIEVRFGSLTVTKRSISIQPVASESIYSQDVTLSDDFTLVNGSVFAWNDDKSVVTYKANSQANRNSNAGEYAVTATATASNYDITVVDGLHTINKITVGVAIRAIDGVYGDSANAGSVSFMSVVATNLDDTPSINGLQFTLKFSGRANNGANINSDSIPAVAGVYTVSVVGVNDGNYEIDTNYGIRETFIEIAKKAVDAKKIIAQSAQYTGYSIRPVIVDTINGSGVYTVSYGEDYANGFVSVGVYSLTLTLTDTHNYCWLDNLNSYDTIVFEVTKADNAVVDDNGNVTDNAKIEISDWTIDGEVSTPRVKLLNGSADVVFEYAASENGDYTTQIPSVAGTYWVRAIVGESSNYNAFVSEAVSFVIHKRAVTMPVVKNGANVVYTGEMLSLEIDNFDDRIMSLDCNLFVKISNGTLTLSALNAGTYTATLSLRDANNYVWADESHLDDGNVIVTWTVERQVLTRLPDASNKIVVNGEDIVFIPEGFNSGIMTIEGNVRAHQGNYTAVVTLKDTANYVWEDTESPSITVAFELTGTNTAFVASICVVSGLCVGLAVMAVILTLVNRRKKRRQDEAIDERSRADGWNE